MWPRDDHHPLTCEGLEREGWNNHTYTCHSPKLMFANGPLLHPNLCRGEQRCAKKLTTKPVTSSPRGETPAAWEGVALAARPKCPHRNPMPKESRDTAAR